MNAYEIGNRKVESTRLDELRFEYSLSEKGKIIRKTVSAKEAAEWLDGKGLVVY